MRDLQISGSQDGRSGCGEHDLGTDECHVDPFSLGGPVEGIQGIRGAVPQQLTVNTVVTQAIVAKTG